MDTVVPEFISSAGTYVSAADVKATPLKLDENLSGPLLLLSSKLDLNLGDIVRNRDGERHLLASYANPERLMDL